MVTDKESVFWSFLVLWHYCFQFSVLRYSIVSLVSVVRSIILAEPALRGGISRSFDIQDDLIGRSGV